MLVHDCGGDVDFEALEAGRGAGVSVGGWEGEGEGKKVGGGKGKGGIYLRIFSSRVPRVMRR